MGAEIERHGPVGIVKIHPVERMMERSLEPDCDEFVEVHTAIAICLEDLRFDDAIRVVVVTGSADDQMLSQVLTARELADMHVINYAAPADALDDTYEHADFVDHGLAGRLEPGWSPALSDEIELPGTAAGRPRHPYSEEEV